MGELEQALEIYTQHRARAIKMVADFSELILVTKAQIITRDKLLAPPAPAPVPTETDE